jgi:hypothetical protein
LAEIVVSLETSAWQVATVWNYSCLGSVTASISRTATVHEHAFLPQGLSAQSQLVTVPNGQRIGGLCVIPGTIDVTFLGPVHAASKSLDSLHFNRFTGLGNTTIGLNSDVTIASSDPSLQLTYVDTGTVFGSLWVQYNYNHLCGDGLDNDLDGLVDLADPGCDDAMDNEETSPLLICDNGVDDDGDGLTDVAEDIGCNTPTDPSELPDCDDGVDNDADGLFDLADPDCEDASDPTEAPPSPPQLTSNGLADYAPEISSGRAAAELCCTTAPQELSSRWIPGAPRLARPLGREEMWYGCATWHRNTAWWPRGRILYSPASARSSVSTSRTAQQAR